MTIINDRFTRRKIFMIRSKSIIAVPPGATIKEQLINREMSQKEFASRMEMTTKHISQLINGEVRLTPDVAVRLEMVLGVPAKFWNNLESIYQEKLIKARAENEMEEDQLICHKFPYSKMAKLGWVPETRSVNEKVFNLRKYFEVVRLGLIEEKKIPGIAYRCLTNSENINYALLAWAQKAKLEARNIKVESISVQKLEKSVQELRKMTMNTPEEFCGDLKKILGDCGVAIVFLPYIESSFLHGATFFDGKKIVLGMTVRGKDADKFWFSLFHEIGHIILGHLDLENGTTQKDEDAANGFAANTLIPEEEFEIFVSNKEINKETIISFANKIGVDRGIVVGRLQKQGYIKFNVLNDLKTKYVLAS